MEGSSGISKKLFEADIERFMRRCGEIVAIEARQRIYQYALEEMTNYYEEYTPIEYVRTNQMLLHSYIPFHEKVGNVYSGGVKIDFENPPTRHHIWGMKTTTNEKGEKITNSTFDEQRIYDLVWIQGKHPVKGRDGQLVGSGINHEDKLRIRAYADKEAIYQKAIAKAKKDKYSLITFR